MPRWSVIMPVRNGEKYLMRAVSSVLSTLPRDAELRIMDDASTDCTPRILSEIAEQDSRVALHRHDQAAGVAPSLNELVVASDSAFIGRMDADDVCVLGRWARGEQMLLTHDMAFMSIVFIDAAGRPRGMDQPGHFSPKALPYHLLLGSMLVHPTAMMRREALTALGGYRQLAAEDYDLWLRASAAGQRLVRSMFVGLLYRRHSYQLTQTSPWRTDRAGSPMWESYCELAHHQGIDLGEDDALAAHAMLETDSLSWEAADFRQRILNAIEAKAQMRLGPLDVAQLHWRLARERRRIRARLK